jgi:hypothetical protein
LADWVTWAAPIVVTIILAFISYYQQNRVIRQQAEEIKQQAEQLEEQKLGRRRETIEKYYPPLAENLRHSLPDIAFMYHVGVVQEYGTYFDVLIEMANQSTLGIIEALDEQLYRWLDTVLEEILPVEKRLNERRVESWKEIPRKWNLWVAENHDSISMWTKAPELFVNEMATNLLWPLWRGEEQLVQQNYDRAYERHILTQGDEIKAMNEKELIYREFLKIVEDEWKPIKDRYHSLENELRELVENWILPRMDETVKSLGE